MLLVGAVACLACNPRASEYEERGDRYSAAGEVVDAQVEYELAIEEAGASPPIRLLLKTGALALRSKNFSEANRVFGELLADAPGSEDRVTGLYRIYAHRWIDGGDTFAALQAIEWLRARDSTADLGALHFAVGDAAYGRPDYDAAIEEYLLGLAHQPSSAPAVVYARLGDAFERRRDCPSAIHYFRRFLDADPEDSEEVREARYRMGACAFRMAERAFANDDWETARRYVDTMIETGEPVSRMDEAALILARIHEREGDREAAMDRYRDIVERNRGRQTRPSVEAFRRLKQLEFGLPLRTSERLQRERERQAEDERGRGTR